MAKLDGIKKYQNESQKKTMDKVDQALKLLKRRKGKITYKVVAEIAGVSEQTLYKNKELKEKVKQAQFNKQTEHLESDTKTGNRILSKEEQEIVELKAEINKYKLALNEERRINSLLIGNLEKKANENFELKIRIASLNNMLDIRR